MKNRSKRKMIIYGLICALFLTSVAYAVLQTTLTISGTVTKKGGTWNIKFENIADITKTGAATITTPTLTSNSTNLNFSATLSKPLDSVSFTVDVKNSGTINAVLDYATLKGKAEAKSNSITYIVTYSDGTALTEGDILNVGASKKLKIMVSYDNVSSISSSDITLNLGLTLIYVQEGSGSTSGGVIVDNEYKESILNGSDPKLSKNLVPIVYNETESKWQVADTTKEWYNYSKQEWANAAILKDGVVTTPGTLLNVPEINNDYASSDIVAMYVWIPRYEYKIEGQYGTHTDGTAGTQDLPGEIKVKFISRTKTTADNGYILHPAFTWDDNSDGTITTNEHISGIWVGKFETTGSASDPTILPNMKSLVEQNVSSQFITAQKFNEYLGISFDAHMMKNSEWGAAAYLSQSIYGKYGNIDYTGANKEVYNNDSSFSYTGRSSGLPPKNGNSTEGTCRYDDIEDRGNGTGLCGGGASTTGNITGVYDMSGGAYEYVMSNLTVVSDTWGAAKRGNYAGFTSAPLSKYYDAYTTTTASTACNGGICYGHALSETENWYRNSVKFVSTNYPWLRRGGNYISDLSTGVFESQFYLGSEADHHSFRSSLLSPGV